jgi:predicted nucleic acid-binding protein
MILVDTSIWIDHLRTGNQRLSELLIAGEVVCHPMVVGELACGNINRRKEIIALLHALPVVDRVSDDEVLFFIEKHKLYGIGLGLIDMHLLASCSIGNDHLWTMDKRLLKTSINLGIGTKAG